MKTTPVSQHEAHDYAERILPADRSHRRAEELAITFTRQPKSARL